MEQSKQSYDYTFAYGDLDYNCYSSKAWRKCLLNAYDRLASQKSVVYEEPQGFFNLRQILSGYLYQSRGVKCSARQIIFTSGHQQSMHIIASLFSNADWGFAMENPGYSGTRQVMEQNHFHKTPIPSLQSIDSNNRTIYLGTFSKSLSPDLRIAYVVLPAHLLPSYREKYFYANYTVPALLQLALAEYIESGEYQRHINTMRTHYRKKHDYIRNYVKETLAGKAVLIREDAGLHFVISIRTKQTQKELIEQFAQNKIRIYPTELFWADKTLCPQNQLLLGFSAIPLTQLPKAMKKLSEVIESIV